MENHHKGSIQSILWSSYAACMDVSKAHSADFAINKGLKKCGR
ncbi:hypothetical protein SAMN05443252_10330 [Bacillus sp. OV322]|nr:hypothetical protein [Bacillus sp. OV322]SFC35686.1 hypothetical protein SAMN05443252_10330 [Bacillus sp. OV322]